MSTNQKAAFWICDLIFFQPVRFVVFIMIFNYMLENYKIACENWLVSWLHTPKRFLYIYGLIKKNIMTTHSLCLFRSPMCQVVSLKLNLELGFAVMRISTTHKYQASVCLLFLYYKLSSQNWITKYIQNAYYNLHYQSNTTLLLKYSYKLI